MAAAKDFSPGSKSTEDKGGNGDRPDREPEGHEQSAERSSKAQTCEISECYQQGNEKSGNQVARIGQEVSFFFRGFEPLLRRDHRTLDQRVIFLLQEHVVSSFKKVGGNLFFVGSKGAV